MHNAHLSCSAAKSKENPHLFINCRIAAGIYLHVYRCSVLSEKHGIPLVWPQSTKHRCIDGINRWLQALLADRQMSVKGGEKIERKEH
jgi:hypothetical protein